MSKRTPERQSRSFYIESGHAELIDLAVPSRSVVLTIVPFPSPSTVALRFKHI